MLEELEDYLGNVNWYVVFGFWIIISILIWKGWASSVVMGTVGYRMVRIIIAFFIITLIVMKMGGD